MLLRFRKSRKRLGNPPNQQVRVREPAVPRQARKQRKLLAAKTFAYANGEFQYANPGRVTCHPPAGALAPFSYVRSPALFQQEQDCILSVAKEVEQAFNPLVEFKVGHCPTRNAQSV